MEEKRAKGKKVKKGKREDKDKDPEPVSGGRGDLPSEVYLRIFGFLSAKDLGRASCVCKSWNAIANEEQLWTKHFLAKWGCAPPKKKKKSQKTKDIYAGRERAPPTAKAAENIAELPVPSQPAGEEPVRGILSIKTVIVGDTGVGKTCLSISYTTEAFPGEYVPATAENYCANVMHNGHPINLSIWDSMGDVEYDKLRRLCYTDAHVFMICYSISDPNSYWGVKERWVPEIRKHAPGVPYLIVGTKEDLREDLEVNARLEERGMRVMNESEGFGLAEEVGAFRRQYIDCSALTQRKLHLAFKTAIMAALLHQRRPQGQSKDKDKKKCTLQ